MLAFALFDENDNLQRSAPDNVVSDGTIPSPHGHRLQAALGCIRCHGASDGFQPFENDVIRLSKPVSVNGKLVQFNAFDDENSKDDIFSTIKRLQGLYSGDLTPLLMSCRSSHELSMYKLVGKIPNSKAKSVVSQVYGRIRTIQDEYEYTFVTPQIAAKEIGFNGEAFNDLVPLLPANAVNIHPENPTIHALRLGLEITRQDWEHDYAEVASRVIIGPIEQAVERKVDKK